MIAIRLLEFPDLNDLFSGQKTISKTKFPVPETCNLIKSIFNHFLTNHLMALNTVQSFV